MASRIEVDALQAGIWRDATNLLLGQRLGAGSSRTVYTNDLNPLTVVKIEAAGGEFQNILEWKIWQEVKDTPLAGWFAPCRFISPNGQLLIQDRTYPARAYPEKIPALFTDLKVTNFGQIEDRFVAHDYGMVRLTKGLSSRLRKAVWWDLHYGS